MIFTITSQGTNRPLELDIFGYHLEVSAWILEVFQYLIWTAEFL